MCQVVNWGGGAPGGGEMSNVVFLCAVCMELYSGEWRRKGSCEWKSTVVNGVGRAVASGTVQW